MTDCRKPPKGKYWTYDWRIFGVLHTSAQQRKAVFERDKGICVKCGLQIGQKFHADHIRALHTLSRSELQNYPSCLKFWALGNLQLLGVACGCHKAKTALEAKSRAKVVRLVRKQVKELKPRHPLRPVPKKWPKPKKQKPVSRHKKVVSYLA
jgi:5-methylcytosine-specific restriction endonuclease McrA